MAIWQNSKKWSLKYVSQETWDSSSRLDRRLDVFWHPRAIKYLGA